MSGAVSQTEQREPQPQERSAKPAWRTLPGTRRYLIRFSMAGLTGALLFYCLSLTPSLLTRAWYLQAVMSGVTVAIGYTAWIFIGWLLRSLIPVYQGGRTVRWATEPAQLGQAGPGWEQPRVVYLQNTSDPIVWWSWELAFHQPDWLRGTHPPDVSSAMHWYPLVTFWQVAADLALSTAVPPGHGHSYGMAQAAGAWASIIPPPGWTAQRTAGLGALAAS